MTNKAEEYTKGIIAGEENILRKLKDFLTKEERKITKSKEIYNGD